MIQYAVRGYEVDAMDYVVKPVEYFSFSQKLDKAVGRMRSEVKEFLTIPIGEGVVKIDIADIYYIEGQRHNVIYYTSRGDYCSRITMKELEEKLAVHNFFRCAKGEMEDTMLYQDIPRIYTAIAEWGSCLVYLYILKKENMKSVHFLTGSLFMLAMQSIFLTLTGSVTEILWFPCMMIAAGMM